MMRIDRLVMPAAAARQLNISKQRVSVLIKRGTLGVRQWQGRTYVTAESLERYAAMPPASHPNQRAGIALRNENPQRTPPA